MRSLDELNSRVGALRTVLANAENSELNRKYELDKLAAVVEQYGETEAMKAEKKAIFEKYAKSIIEARQTALAIKQELDEAADCWLDVEHVLSTRPVSETGSNLFQAKDSGVEAMARLSLSNELKNVQNDQLHLRAKDAKQAFRYGELFLINQEMNTRTESPGWKPIDLTGVMLPDQHKARQIFAEVNASTMAVEHMATVAIGGTVDSVATLTLGHAIAALEALNCPVPEYQHTAKPATAKTPTAIERLAAGHADAKKEE